MEQRRKANSTLIDEVGKLLDSQSTAATYRDIVVDLTNIRTVRESK